MDKPADSASSLPWWLAPWLPGGGTVPQQLNQPILPGWSLISITEQNSSRPDTEREIVAHESYGRQIGRLLDAVAALVAERPAGAPEDPAFAALGALRARIDAIKCDAAERRIDTLREDLAALKRTRPAAFAERAAALRTLLDQEDE
jgi:hypothetical protein